CRGSHEAGDPPSELRLLCDVQFPDRVRPATEDVQFHTHPWTAIPSASDNLYALSRIEVRAKVRVRTAGTCFGIRNDHAVVVRVPGRRAAGFVTPKTPAL